jgi:hypothetical protein
MLTVCIAATDHFDSLFSRKKSGTARDGLGLLML